MKVSTSNSKRLILSMLAIFVVALQVLLSSSVVHASGVSTTADYSREVYQRMQSEYSNIYYQTSGGGTYGYSDLLVQDVNTNVYTIDGTKFSQLTNKAQTEFLSNLDTCASYVANNSGMTFNSQSQTNWYQILQQEDGVGSRFMNVILQNTKPDFVTANKIYQPFSGIIGTVLGLFAVLIMGFLGIVMVADIAYITLPPVRLFVADNDKGEGVTVSKIFSHDALYAVQVAESRDSGNGSPKQALGIYFKRRVIMLILLGICLMYLIQGQIYTLVGYILDLVSGFM